MDYTLVFLNNSTQNGSACVYQQYPDTNRPDIMSLAWFSKPAAPSTTLQFIWTIDYSFVWSQTGSLIPGVLFTAAQSWDADLSLTNQVQFSKLANQAYTFQNQSQGPQQGTLYIIEDGTVVANEAAVGIGMSGSGTFAVASQPNMTAMFTPTPQYWITFGTFIQGQVLDITTITNAAQIVFPPNVYSMTAILNPNNTWTVMPTSEVNDLLLEAREKDAKALWGQIAA